MEKGDEIWFAKRTENFVTNIAKKTIDYIKESLDKIWVFGKKKIVI